MDKKYLLILTCLLFLLTGCSASPESTANHPDWKSTWTKIGNNIAIDAPKELTLLDQKEALAAEGLYYATWTAGSSVPYENSDGETIDLYDAQLYFLASESTKETSAQQNCSAWLAAAKENYDVQAEDIITCNGHSYTLITYRCVSENTPYDRGVSAFGTCGNIAVCAEFTCVENYSGDLESILTQVLDGCHYSTD